jgi:hypothetical protein
MWVWCQRWAALVAAAAVAAQQPDPAAVHCPELLFGVPFDESRAYVCAGDAEAGFERTVARFCAARGAACAAAAGPRLLPLIRFHWSEWEVVKQIDRDNIEPMGYAVGVRHDQSSCEGPHRLIALFCLKLSVNGEEFQLAVRDGTSGADAVALLREHTQVQGLGRVGSGTLGKGRVGSVAAGPRFALKRTSPNRPPSH